MSFKDWTILLVPHNDIQIHKLKISRWLILAGVFCCIVVASGIGYLTLSSYNKKCDYLELINLQRENRILTGKLVNIEHKFSSLNTEISALMEENQIFRRIAGLEVLDEEIKEVGIGGTFAGSYDELFEMNSSLARKIYSQEDQADELLRKADLISQSLLEAIESMEANTGKWNHYPSIMPTDGYISSHFGRRRHPIFHIKQVHIGIDISCPSGAPIIAPADGEVKIVKQQIGYGLTVVLDHGYGIKTRFAHCLKSSVRVGQKVERGDVIALVGKSGITTGPNLHYEVHVDGVPQDPLNFILDNHIP